MKKIYLVINVFWLMPGFLIQGQTIQRSVISSLGIQSNQLGLTIGQPVSGASEDTTFYGVLGYQHPLKFPLDTSINAPSLVNVCGKTYRLEAGQAPYYQWFNGNILIPGAVLKYLLVKEAGTYRVQFSDGKSQTVNSRAIRIFFRQPPPAEVISTGTVNVCAGKNVVLRANHISGASYQWKKSGQPIRGATAWELPVTETGYYSVTVTSQYGCIGNSTNVLVRKNSVPVVSISSPSPPVVCPGASVVLKTTQYAGNSYRWKFNGITITGATISTYSATMPGSYTAEVVTSAGCVASSIPYILNAAVNCQTGNISANTDGALRKMTTADEAAEASIDIYPNPLSHGQALLIRRNGSVSGILRYSITDITGRAVKSGSLAPQERQLRWDAPAGIYQLIITDSNNKNYIFRIVRN